MLDLLSRVCNRLDPARGGKSSRRRPRHLDAFRTSRIIDGTAGLDQVVFVSFPFPLQFYGFPYSGAYVSEDGLVRFDAADSSFSNTCAPISSDPNFRGIAVNWGDQRSSVYAGVNGTAPHREFIIEWIGSSNRTQASVDYALRFAEDSTTLEDWVISGSDYTNFTSAVQADPTVWAQGWCNPPSLRSPFVGRFYWDDTPPTVTKAPTPQLATGRSVNVNPATVPVTIAWNGQDAQSGVKDYEPQSTADGTHYTDLSTTVYTPVTSILDVLPPGFYYPYRVRARNNIDLVSGFKKGLDTRLGGVQESSTRITYTGTWTRVAGSSFWGGFEEYSSGSGASASFTCSTCRAIGWVTRKDNTRGSAKVYLDGTLVTTINTYLTAPTDRGIVFAKSFGARGSHTLEIVNSASAGHPKVGVDAFVTL